MAILTAAELKASREAIEAGVSTVTDPVAEDAIRKAEAKLNLALGYKVAHADGTVSFTVSSDTDLLYLPQRVRTISTVTDTAPGSSAESVGTNDFALRGSGFRLFRYSRWQQDHTVAITGTFGYATTDDQYVLAKEFVLLAAVRYLQRTSNDDNMPTPAGAVLTGLASESTSFTFFTPTTEAPITGYADLDLLIDQIGRHPNKQKGLHTISISGGLHESTFDDIIAGRENIDYLFQ